MKTPIIKNTMTNYLMVFVRILQGILVTRWLIEYLGDEYYGLWTLLWSFFIYGLLLDFGLGASAQKFTSSGLYKKEPEKYNGIISVIFSFHASMSLLIVAGTAVASLFMEEITKISDPEKLKYCVQCFWMFGIGVACIFPLGMFPEIMVGLQKIYLRNYINMSAKIVELVGILVILFLGGRIQALIIFSIGMTMLTNLVMGYLVFKQIPGLRLRLKIEWPLLKEITHFSGYLYVSAFSRLALTKLNRLLISIFWGLKDVGIFQMGTLIPANCLLLASQYQENMYPLSSAMHANGDKAGLKTMIFHSMRWNSFVGTGITFIAYFLISEALGVLFSVYDSETSEIGRIMLLSTYVTVACRAIPNNVLIMSDQHRFVAITVVVEAVLNIVLYLFFLRYYTPICVVWINLAINAAIAIFVIFPFMIRHYNYNAWLFAWRIIVLPILAVLPALVLLIVMRNWCGGMANPKTSLFIAGSCAALVYGVISWMIVLNGDERAVFMKKILKFYDFVKKIFRINRDTL